MLYCCSDSSTPPSGEAETTRQLPPRVVELPCDYHKIAKSEDSFFCGGELRQSGLGLDCFVQVQKLAYFQLNHQLIYFFY